MAVVAHEMGHWKLSHTLKSFGTSQVTPQRLLAHFVLDHSNFSC